MDFSVSPLDIEFPQLIRLLDLAHVRDIFASMGTSVPLFCKPRLGSCRVTSVRYRPGQRHVLRYDERGAHRSIFAKLYARGKAAEVFRIVTQAGEWLAQSMPGASVVCPVAHVIEDDAVFYDGLLGTALSDLIGQPWRKLTTYLERAGDMLCTLHQLPKAMAGPLETHDFAAELSEVARTGAYIGVLLPSVGRAVESILERAGRVHGRLGQEPPTFTHGDFKSEHVWVSAGGLTLMDFDSSRFGDPALDVGKFLAYLQLSQINRPQPDLQVAEAGFLAAYGRGVPEERLLRAQLYKTVELLKITARRVSVTDADWASRIEKLIACAEHLMTDLELVLGLPVVEASAAGSRTRGLRIRAGRTPVPGKGVLTQWMTR
jgi:aminoglycoside phosphotransferase (APT) family kinase protein